MRYEVFKDSAGEWRWRLRAANNVDIIATSGEGYVRKEACLRGISLVKQSQSAPVYEV